MTRRLVLRMPYGARKKAQEDGPIGWTVKAPSKTRRASQRSPRTGLKSPRKLEAQYCRFDAPLRAPQIYSDPRSGISVPATPPMHLFQTSCCLPSQLLEDAHSRDVSTYVSTGFWNRRLALRQPDLMLHPFRASVCVTGTS
jgi:hypothetical protein